MLHGYGKINGDNYLMTSHIYEDNSWIDLNDFVRKPDGSHYTYYIDLSTPDFKKEKELEKQEKKKQIEDEMNNIIGGMSGPESMFMMLRYGIEKMRSMQGTNNPADPADPADPSDSLVPDNKDLLEWGDQVSIKLEEKIRELRKLEQPEPEPDPNLDPDLGIIKGIEPIS